jgi:hypothetical protein
MVRMRLGRDLGLDPVPLPDLLNGEA